MSHERTIEVQMPTSVVVERLRDLADMIEDDPSALIAFEINNTAPDADCHTIRTRPEKIA